MLNYAVPNRGINKMSIGVDNIVSQLPSMSVSELSKIKQLTELLIGGQGQETYDTDDERLLFQALKSELSAAGLHSALSYSSLTGKYQKPWKRSVQVVSEFMDTSFAGLATTEAQRLGLCRIFVQAMIKEFKKRGIPVSLGTLASNLHRVQQAFDRAFPSYLQSGLAPLIVKSMQRRPERA